MTQQQILNCLAAAKQERKNIRELEQELAKTTDKYKRSVLQYRIKVCKKFLLKHLQSVQAEERAKTPIPF
jgi:hypothetical protein